MGANASLVERLHQIEGVGPVSTFRYATTIADVKPVISKGNASKKGITVSLLGIDPVAFPQVSGLRFNSGDPVTAYADLEGARTVIVNPIFAAAAGLKVGDVIPLITPEGHPELPRGGGGRRFHECQDQYGLHLQANLAQIFTRPMIYSSS